MPTFTIYYGAAAPINARGAHQCRLLAFAEKYRGWHSLKGREAVRAANALAQRGCVEISGDQFRFTYPRKD